MKFSVTQLGEELSTKKYNWDEETRTFSTTENNLVLNFSGIDRLTFKTGYNCTFNTGSGCIFYTGSGCTFKTGYGCTFTCKEKCVCVRRDIFEIIEVPIGQKIKLNDGKIPGFVLINPERTITIDGKEIKLSEESYQSFKKQFKDS